MILSLNSSTFTLGAQDHFNKILEKTDQKFTYLVPSNEAWKNLQLKMASTFKVLFHGDFAYQVSQTNFRKLRSPSNVILSFFNVIFSQKIILILSRQNKSCSVI